MSRLERHIADYAQALEDADWGRRMLFHKDLCEHLGVAHSEFQPFEGHSYVEPHWHIPRARAAKTIRDAIDKLKKEKGQK
jgi:hypothetical protein